MGFSYAMSEHQVWGEKLPSPHPAAFFAYSCHALYFARVWEPQALHIIRNECAHSPDVGGPSALLPFPPRHHP